MRGFGLLRRRDGVSVSIGGGVSCCRLLFGVVGSVGVRSVPGVAVGASSASMSGEGGGIDTLTRGHLGTSSALSDGPKW